MHNNPVIVQLVSDPSVNEEYSQKISELDRRLKMNNLSYEHWDTLNDRQRETFVLDLFMDGDSASSIENYAENAYHNCDCPDVVDDLEQDSPALMARIQNAKAYVAGQPAPARPVQFESLIDGMIDNLLAEVSDPVARLGTLLEEIDFGKLLKDGKLSSKWVAGFLKKNFKMTPTGAEIKAIQKGFEVARAQKDKRDPKAVLKIMQDIMGKYLLKAVLARQAAVQRRGGKAPQALAQMKS